MNKIVLWGGICQFSFGILLLVFNKEFPKNVFSFGPWFWISLSGWVLFILSFLKEDKE